MKRSWIALFICAAILCAAVSGCAQGEENSRAPEKIALQGVTDTEVLVGGIVPADAPSDVAPAFQAGLSAALEAYNNAGGFRGRTVRLIWGTGEQALVEEDMVFALVGGFRGEEALDRLRDVGIPTVCALSGGPGLYREDGGRVFPVQPTYEGEGRILLARALASAKGGCGLGGAKVGVIATASDDGQGLKAGVERQAQQASAEIVCQDVDPSAADHSAAVNVLKNAGCDVVIICSNQTAMGKIMNAMRDADYNAKCITTYTNAAAMGALVADSSVTADRPLYCTVWLDASTEDGMAGYMDFAAAVLEWEAENGIDAEHSFILNAYAMAGYIAGTVFTAGLDRLEEQGLELTWENYAAALEAEVDIPMGGAVDFTSGQRLGTTDLALNAVSLKADADGSYALAAVSPIMGLDEVWSRVG